MKTHDDILNLLQADIICFQEMKSSRQNLPKAVGVPPSYHSFFSFPLQKHGYSGVAVYARAESAFPRKAEEGLTGLLQPKPPLSAAERVSVREAYPDEMMADAASSDLVDFRSLDSEGRALVVDFGLFVLVNVYCPNDGTETEERLQYKMDFHRVLEARVKGLIEVEKRQVIVVGDLNACAAVIDHCEGNLMVARGQAEGLEGEDGFWERDVRRWLRSWLISDDEPGTPGCLVDVVRRFWPERKGMYTCWNTKISARESNYGTRIDYILVTPGLLPWIKAADIQPEIKGSDHCPVFIDLHDEIVGMDGGVIKLRDVLGPRAGGAEPPRIAAKFWDEYKQRLLDTFFGKKTAAKTDPSAKGTLPQPQGPQPTPTPDPPIPSATLESAVKATSAVSSASELPDDRHSSASQPGMSSTPSLASAVAPAAKRKRDTSTEPVASSSKKPKKDNPKPKKSGQTSLASFFSNSSSKVETPSPSSSKTKIPTSTSAVSSSSKTKLSEADLLDADYKLALSLSQESASPSRSQSNGGETKKAWSTLLAPIQPPLCQVHGEPTKELTVNKPGPNKGKNFFICSRCVVSIPSPPPPRTSPIAP